MTLGRTGLCLAILRILNAGFGFILNIGLACVFGVGHEVDALFVAMSFAVFLARDLATVIRTAAVPCLVGAEGKHCNSDFQTSFLGAMVVTAALVALVTWLVAPVIVAVTSPGFDRHTADMARQMLSLLVPSMLLILLFGSAQAVFHAHRRFLAPEVGEALWRVISISALFAIGPRWGIEAFTATLSAAAFMQWSLLFIVGKFSGLSILPERWGGLKPQLLRPFWIGTLVVLCSIVQMQIEGIMDRAILSYLSPGSIALFSYADRIARMIPVLLSTSLLIPWLPEMARIHARVGDPRKLAKQGSLFLSGLGLLLALVIGWGATDAVSILCHRGRIASAAVEVITRAVWAFAPGLPAIYCVQCLAGLFIVERNLNEMIRLGIVALALHAFGNLTLCGLGVPGIAMSGTLTVWGMAVYLWWRIRSPEPVWFPWLRFTLAGAAVCAVLHGLPWATLLPWQIPRLLAGGLAAWLVYTTVMWPAIRRMQDYERWATQPEDAGSD